MRFMVLLKSTDAEMCKAPDPALGAAMMKFHEELARAGVLLGGEGLHPSDRGAQVRVQGGKQTVLDGPFAETKELIAGFWLWQVRSREEALEWLRRSPFRDANLELREVRDHASRG